MLGDVSADVLEIRNRGWRVHWVSCMRPTNTRNISVTASHPWPVLAVGARLGQTHLRERLEKGRKELLTIYTYHGRLLFDAGLFCHERSDITDDVPILLSKPTKHHCLRFITTTVVTLRNAGRCGNVIENKGPPEKTWWQSGNVHENKGDMSLKWQYY